MMRWCKTLLGLVCLPGLLTGCGRERPRAVVDTFDAAFRIQANGSVDVREQLSVSPDAAVTSFERRAAFDRADGVTFVSASIDGREVTARQTADQEISFSDGRVLRVRWRLAPAAPHVLVLHYQARNAVEIYGNRGHVRLNVLDAARDFDVTMARLSLLPPDGIVLDNLSGVSQAGWTVARESGGVVAERRQLGRDEVATVAGGLPIDRSQITDPVWQLNADRAEQFTPAFISGGLFILVIGVGILWIVRFEHPRSRKDDGAERRIVRRGLRIGGLACVVLSGVVAPVTWLALSQFGIWTMAIPASILIVGLLLAAVAGWIV